MREMTHYEKDLSEWLKDPDNAAEYLTASIEEGDKDAMKFGRPAFTSGKCQ